MPGLEAVCHALTRIAPLRLAESWDNVGLLVGDRAAPVSRAMTCLTITPEVVDEAEADQVDLIVVHHPLPFKPMHRVTTDSIAGAMLLRLIRSGVAVYSAHTAFDSAAQGINQMWAETLSLDSIGPLTELSEVDPQLGSGRYGKLATPMTLEVLVRLAASAVGAKSPRRVGRAELLVKTVAFACGSGGTFLSAARRCGCDALITGEATFHTCLEAEASSIGLGLLGHYWSERLCHGTARRNARGGVPGDCFLAESSGIGPDLQCPDSSELGTRIAAERTFACMLRRWRKF